MGSISVVEKVPEKGPNPLTSSNSMLMDETGRVTSTPKEQKEENSVLNKATLDIKYKIKT